VSVIEVGQGPPLLIVPGGPGLGHYYLRPHMDRLAERCRVIYYDPRGTGKSSSVGDRMTLAGAIDEIGAIQNDLGIERMSLLGHSIGALVALVYAGRNRDSIRSLVLANPAPPFSTEQREAFDAAMAARRTRDDQARMDQIKRSEGFAKQDPSTLEDFARLTYRPFFVDRAKAERLELNFTEVTAANLKGAGEKIIAELEALKPEEVLSRVTCPTLIVSGRLEPIAEEFLNLLAHRINRSEMVSLSGVSHFAYLEHPKAFFDPVLNFLETNTS
jgi:proline iminopeptidase